MKNKRTLSLIFTLIFVLPLLLLSGCAPLATEMRPRFFWPPPPVEPKIEYINFYLSDDDLQRGVDRRFEQAILGKAPPRRLINQPFSVASDGHGRFFVIDFVGPTVHVFDLLHHKYRQLGSKFKMPQKVLVDSAGYIWVLDSHKGVLFTFASDETMISEITLPDVGRAGSFAVDRQRQRIYVADTIQHQLRVYDLSGRFLEIWGGRGFNPGEFNYPGDIDLDANGNIYIVDVMNARIQVLAPDGAALRTFGERGTVRGAFSMPKGIAVSPSGLIYVSDATQHKIVIFSQEGDYLLTLGARYIFEGAGISPGGFNFPAGLDVDNNDTLWVCDMLNGLVHEFQYLTPEFLAKKPIRTEEIYLPQTSDLKEEKTDNLLPAPVN